MKNIKTIVYLNVGMIDDVKTLIDINEDHNVIVDSMPTGTTKEELIDRLAGYRQNYLISEIVLLNEAANLLKTGKTLKLNK